MEGYDTRPKSCDVALGVRVVPFLQNKKATTIFTCYFVLQVFILIQYSYEYLFI